MDLINPIWLKNCPNLINIIGIDFPPHDLILIRPYNQPGITAQIPKHNYCLGLEEEKDL